MKIIGIAGLSYEVGVSGGVTAARLIAAKSDLRQAVGSRGSSPAHVARQPTKLALLQTDRIATEVYFRRCGQAPKGGHVGCSLAPFGGTPAQASVMQALSPVQSQERQ